MSTTDAKYRKLTVVEELRISDDTKLLLRDDAIYIYSDGDGSLMIVTDSAIKLDANTTMQTGHQFNGAADGVVNYTKAGTISDADFITDTSGLIGIDTTNDRIYFKTASSADWHYCTKDAGFSFPEKACPLCGKPFKVGDRLDMMVDGFASDGAPHAIPVHRRCV